jgi:hypothetical protein
VIHITGLKVTMVYIVDSLTMGRICKVVLLSLLLILAGVPRSASCFCAQPQASQGHICCKAHQMPLAAHCGMTPAQSVNASCCNIAPITATPALTTRNPGRALDGAIGPIASNEIASDQAPILLSGRGSARLVKLQHSRIRTLLCSFLL